MKNNILTGQQLGLLGGPLYTTYKVLGAINLAKEIDGNAVYWLETNDADFNEINHIDYIDKYGELKILKWDIDTKGYSCGYIKVDEKLIELLNTFFSTIHQTEYTEELKNEVLEAYKLGRNLGDASKSLAEKLFGKYGLRLFDPSEKEFRTFSKNILFKEAERGENNKQCNLFCLDEKKRLAIFKKDNNYCLRNGEKIDISKYELLPNVKTRNLCQDAFFNTHTYIAGPGEVKYIKELDEYYKTHEIIKSKVQPRMSIDLIEPRIRKLLKKIGLNLIDIENKNFEQVLKEELIKFSGFDKKTISEKLTMSVDVLIKSFEEAGMETKELRKLLHSETKKLIGEKRKAIKIDFESKQKNIEIIFNNLKPFDKRQERVFNIFYYMNLYGGFNFIDILYNNYNVKNQYLEL